MAKKHNETNKNKNPVLVKPRLEVSSFLKNRIEIGREILQKDVRSEDDLDNVYKEKEKWHKFNLEYLKHCFDIDSIAEEYDFSGTTNLYINASFSQSVSSLRESVQLLINEIESIDERLSLFQERLGVVAMPVQHPSPRSDKIFIVHGHDEALKHKVARLVKRLDLEEIILDEQPNAGMTVIEKFEQHAQGARYAIVLLTHDDIGYPKNSPEEKQPRARQNAVAELGYFLHALGRKNIAILCSEQIEIPSDFRGVLYIPVKEDGSWELHLAKEMKAAGLNIDLNKL